ncbi:MAG: formate dehydrogenase accessory sulfurtransferase FdhD [Paracoccaceae bacterium]
MTGGHDSTRAVPRTVHRAGRRVCAPRTLAEEVPVAIVCNGTTQAVMMATPDALEDFAAGFALTEHIVDDLSGIESIEVVGHDHGIEARLSLRARPSGWPPAAAQAGPSAVAVRQDSEEVLRPVARIAASGLVFPASGVAAALSALRARQDLHDSTRSVHAAGFFVPGRGMLAVREDVGRHNALDKLAGALLRDGVEPGTGAVVLTSRVSVEMVQKTARLGAPVLIAVSAPTAHAVRLAETAGLTLIASARDDGFESYAHADRLAPKENSDVA